MNTKQSTPESIQALSGTTWSFTDEATTGTFHFEPNNTGTYVPQGDSPSKFYWWQSGNSFLMQVRGEKPNWLCIIEGELTAINKGKGNIIVAEQNTDTMYLDAFTMTLSS